MLSICFKGVVKPVLGMIGHLSVTFQTKDNIRFKQGFRSSIRFTHQTFAISDYILQQQAYVFKWKHTLIKTETFVTLVKHS